MSKSPSDRHDLTYYEMTGGRRRFLSRLTMAFYVMINKRYAAGQKEHGGDLWLKATYPMLGSELIDAYTYYQTHRARMRHWLKLLTTDSELDELDGIDTVIVELRQELGTEDSAESLSTPADGVLYAFDS